MKKIVNIINAYDYAELSAESKEVVKEWLLDDYIRTDLLEEMIVEHLSELFLNSDLKVQFSLSNCQGDGLNVYGDLNLLDFLNSKNEEISNIFSNYSDKEIRRLKFYFDKCDVYHFTHNNRYAYSCKFIDIKNISDTTKDVIGILQYNDISNIDSDIITRFLQDCFGWFATYDKKMETFGYEYLYEMSEDEIQETCETNNYLFLETGVLYN